MQSYQISHWEQSAFLSQIDVLVIGSGIVGLNAAIRIKELQPHYKVIIIERGPLPAGASTRNAGFACFGSASELRADYKEHGSAVWELVARRWEGLQALRNLLGDTNIGYEHRGGFELFSTSDSEEYEACAAHLKAFNQELKSMTGKDEVFRLASSKIGEFGFAQTQHLIENTAEGQIDTGLMMKNLIRLARSAGIEIINGLAITTIEEESTGVRIQTESGWELTASKALIATNGFVRTLLPELSVQPARNQVFITTPLPDLRVRGCFHVDRGYVYFRNVGDRLLIGGFRNLEEERETTVEFGHTKTIQTALHKFVSEVILPGQAWEVERSWSGILGVGTTKTPIIRRISDRIQVGVRLGGMGIAIGTLVGREAANSLMDA